ncbi:hypothetical protein AWB99_10805 [Mycolicibacterium confluentis]|nr:hypothetical protein AWB99_10805 [Mycolicibacterium confluentis]
MPAQCAERFSTMMRGLEFLPNSPTLMNDSTDLGLLAGCFARPVLAQTDSTSSGGCAGRSCEF